MMFRIANVFLTVLYCVKIEGWIGYETNYSTVVLVILQDAGEIFSSCVLGA